jgi:outer membrane protein TolC
MARKNLAFILATALAAAAANVMADELSLQQAIDLALRQNPGLRSAELAVRAAEGQSAVARGALVPQVTASGTAMRLNSLIDMRAGETYYLPVLSGSSYVPTGDVVPMAGFDIATDKIGNTYAGKLSAQWPIYTGGRVWQGYQISRLGLKSARQELDTTRAGIVLSVKRAYYGLMLARHALAVITEAGENIGRHVERVQAMYRKGLVSRLDLLRAEVQQSNLQPQIIRMQNAAELARYQLNLVLDRNLDEPVTPADSLVFRAVALDSAALIQEALKSRPELAQMEIAKKIADRAALVSYSGLQPSLVLMADYSYSKGQGFSGDQWQKNWDLGVAASWTLFDGGSSLGRIKEAKSNARRVLLAREQVEDYIRLEVTAGILSVRAGERAIASQEKAVEQAAEALKMAQARYETGQATNLDVLDAQLALTQAKTNRIQAVHDYLVSLAQLERASGRSLE